MTKIININYGTSGFIPYDLDLLNEELPKIQIDQDTPPLHYGVSAKHSDSSNLHICAEKLNYITFNISHVYNSFKRDLLGDINLLNTDDFYQELEKNKNSLYIDKKFRIISNNCEFEAKVTFMNLVLQEEYKSIASETIFLATE
jgi:hypothetical protein